MNVPIDPGWLTLLPPILAIVLALIFREVVLSLFAGVWIGALLLNHWNPGAASLRAFDQFILGALSTDADHVSIVFFSLMLGGMVGVMSRSGGTRGIVEALRPLATSPRRAQFFSWLAGITIFFDDYANTLIVGNTMRPVTDRLNVSREKLSYIVDSTAAPMAAIAVISTWVGFEISLIGDALNAAAAQADPAQAAGLRAGAENPFNVFLHSIPYLFYPILALYFVLLTCLTEREFGPMRVAEARARSGGGVLRPGSTPAADVSGGMLEPADSTPRRWVNAGIPIITVILVALIGIYATGAASMAEGTARTLRNVVGGADPYLTLIWASCAGVIAAMVLAVSQRILTLGGAIEAWIGGMRAMFMAVVILVLAWALGDVTEALGTGPYLSGMLQETLPIRFVPVLVFIVAAATSFATGTSWGTMAILFPVVIPLAVAMGAGVGFETDGYTILLGVISSVMAGSIFGDHCSPISDTTVMSSMASACDHIDHVRTQLPYAVVVAVVAMAVGDIPTAFGLSPWMSLVLGAALLWGILRVFGKPIADRSATAGQPAGAVSP